MSQVNTNSVEVSNIANNTTEHDIRQFFGFCGRIEDISVQHDGIFTNKANITFNTPIAVQTAQLLDKTLLNGHAINIKHVEEAPSALVAETNSDEQHHVVQAEKPRTRILAEYLAYGYHISDQIIEKGIEFDKQNGISAAFQQVLRKFDGNFATWDAKHHVNERATQVGEKHHILENARHAFNSIESYFEKALNTQTGHKLRQFYEKGEKEVRDVHNEAKYLAGFMKEKQGHCTCVPGTESKECKCPDQKSHCEGCAQTAGESGLEHQRGVTAEAGSKDCGCDTVSTHCKCPKGTCHCDNCPKNTA